MLSLLAHLFPIGLLECPDHLLHELTICAVSNHSSPQIPYAHNTSYVFYHLCISNVEEAAFFFTIFIAPRDLSSLRWHEFAQNFQHRGYSFCFFDSTKRKTIRQAFLASFSAWFLVEHTKKRSLGGFFPVMRHDTMLVEGWSEWNQNALKVVMFQVCWFLIQFHSHAMPDHAHEAHVLTLLTSLLEIPSEIKHPFARSVQIGQGVLTPRLAESVQLLYVLFGQSRYLVISWERSIFNATGDGPTVSQRNLVDIGPWTAKPAGFERPSLSLQAYLTKPKTGNLHHLVEALLSLMILPQNNP